MRILHYTLGLEPNRSGGLIRYVTDLSYQQLINGNDVALLIPEYKIFKHRMLIKKERFKFIDKINVYGLYNSLPLPLNGGIKEAKDFMRKVDPSVYRNFLKKIKPDVVHVHTLMGIHKEFFEEAKKLGIKVVFTSHDYFGLAPEPTLFYKGASYSSENINMWCRIAESSLDTKLLRLFQMPYYYLLKTPLKLISKLKKDDRKKVDKLTISEKKYEDFSKLRNYYISIFDFIDVFHFNSQLSAKVYRKTIKNINESRVITITNINIKGNETHRKLKEHFNVGYIGPYKEYKGFFEFLNLAKKYKNNKYFDFHVWGGYKKYNLPEYVKNHGKFKNGESEKIYKNLDVVVVPSIWQETFGLVVIEALDAGCVVFCSSNVGAGDLVPDRYVFERISDINLSSEIINQFKNTKQKTMKQHYFEIKNLYKGEND